MTALSLRARDVVWLILSTFVFLRYLLVLVAGQRLMSLFERPHAAR